jgi:cell wall-associated protease
MASPVVAGVAALVMSYYPSLTAADVKKIVLESATKLGDRQVIRPGETSSSVSFADLSATGGIVNAYNALKRAEEVARVRP